MKRLVYLVSVILLSHSNITVAGLPGQIDRLAQPYVESETVVGMSIGVIKGEESVVRGYGRLSVDGPRVPDGQTFHEIGSLLKSVYRPPAGGRRSQQSGFARHASGRIAAGRHPNAPPRRSTADPAVAFGDAHLGAPPTARQPRACQGRCNSLELLQNGVRQQAKRVE